MFRRVTADDVADMRDKDRKNYEARLARKAGAKAPAAAGSAGGTDNQTAEADPVPKTSDASPPKKRNRGGWCKMMQTAPPSEAAGGSLPTPSTSSAGAVNRSRDTASKVTANSRYTLRPRPDAPEVSAELFAELKAARNKKRLRAEESAERSPKGGNEEENADEEEEDVFVPDMMERAHSEDASEWIAGVVDAALDDEGRRNLADLVAPKLVVSAGTVNLELVKKEGLTGEIDYGEAIDLTCRGSSPAIIPGESPETQSNANAATNPTKTSILGDRRPKAPFVGRTNFTVVVRDAIRSVSGAPGTDVISTEPKGSAIGTVHDPQGDTGIITSGDRGMRAMGKKVGVADGTGQTSNDRSVSGGTSIVADHGDSEAPDESGASRKIKSVVVATATFRIPRRDPNKDKEDERGMDYVGPLNGPSTGCRIPDLPPQGDQKATLCVRNWQSMKGRPRRVQTPKPINRRVETLLSPEAFLKRYGRPSLTAYGGRAHSAERLNESSCPALMRPAELDESLTNPSVVNPGVARKSGATEEELRRLNERLLRMAGLETPCNAERDMVVTLRPSASVPDLCEEFDPPAIEISGELLELAGKQRSNTERGRDIRAEANEAALMKLAAQLAGGGGDSTNHSEREGGANKESADKPRLPLPPLLAVVPEEVQQSWAALQMEREDKIKKGRRGRNGVGSSTADKGSPRPDANSAKTTEDIGVVDTTEQSAERNTGTGTAETPGNGSDGPGDDRGSNSATNADASESHAPLPESRAERRERASAKAKSPDVKFVTTDTRAKKAGPSRIGSDESETDIDATSAEKPVSKAMSSPQVVTTRLTVNLGSPVSVPGGERSKIGTASQTPPSVSAGKTAPHSSVKPSSKKSAAVGKATIPHPISTKKAKPRTSTPPSSNPSTPSPIQKPPSSSPSHSKTSTPAKQKPPKQTVASGAATDDSKVEGPSAQRGVLKELEQELKTLETKDTELTVEVRVLRAAVQARKESLKVAEDQYAAATANRESVRKRKQELQDVLKRFPQRGTARRGAAKEEE